MLVLLSRVVSCLKILYLFCSYLQVLHKFHQIANPQLFRGTETFPTSKLNIPNENFRHEVVVDNLEGLRGGRTDILYFWLKKLIFYCMLKKFYNSCAFQRCIFFILMKEMLTALGSCNVSLRMGKTHFSRYLFSQHFCIYKSSLRCNYCQILMKFSGNVEHSVKI